MCLLGFIFRQKHTHHIIYVRTVLAVWLKLLYKPFGQSKGVFNNYLDKMRGEGVKNDKILSTYLLNAPQHESYSPNVSTNAIRVMGCRQCLPLSFVQLKGKHCRKPHCCNAVVDMFGYTWFLPDQTSKQGINLPNIAAQSICTHYCM